ncbi:MAG: outer membrane beta-barrel protein [Saprospiraceae bacterium]|nr:outer membrane beta-barrel protein [Saprospiraceae bacterium]MBK9728128.1 outer membrane beta-barrel protein [Saprospiraceae bacterium]
MKKSHLVSIAILAIIIIAPTLNAQRVNRTFGAGLQTTPFTYGLSAKYGVSDNIALQGIIAPFSVSVFNASVSLNYYGGRFIYRFPGEINSGVVLDPYLFIGLGVMVLSSNFIEASSVTVIKSYMVGAGLELILAKKIGLSLDVSYGKQDILGLIAVNSTAIGGGVHYYFN